MPSVISAFVEAYASSSSQLQKKSKTLAWTALILGVFALALSAVMFATGAVAAGAVIGVFVAFCLATLLLLRTGRYFFTSSFFLFGLFAVMLAAIAFDAYQDIYECYVFGTLGGFLLVLGAMIGNKSRQMIILCGLLLIAIFFLFFCPDIGTVKVGAYWHDPRAHSVLAVQSLVTACLFAVLDGLFAWLIVKGQNLLLDDVEKKAAFAEGHCRALNDSVLDAQGSASKIGQTLADASSRTIDAVRMMQVKAETMVSGMDDLDKAIRSSSAANEKTVAGHDAVKESLGSFSAEVTRSSSAIGELAASIRSVAQQAERKREAVRSLQGLADQGERKLQSVKEAIDGIQDSSKKVKETSAFIEDVAGRTNLLGLNASIEAAHAGAEGKGFAIVADQIRSLSEEVAKSSRLISDTLAETETAVGEATAESADAQAFFRTIAEDIRGVSSMIEELLSSVQEMSEGTDDLLHSVQAVAALTGKTDEAVAGSAEAIQSSSRGIQAVGGIAGSLRESTREMAERFGQMLQDAEEVHRLGGENLSLVEGLKARVVQMKEEMGD